MKRIYTEKRAKRSHYFIEALRYYMESVSQKENLKALVLADMDGLVVSEYHSDHCVKPEEIASYCPLIIKMGGNCYDGKMQLDGSQNFSMLLFLYHEQPLYLVAVGGQEDVCDVLLSIMEGVQRILGN